MFAFFKMVISHCYVQLADGKSNGVVGKICCWNPCFYPQIVERLPAEVSHQFWDAFLWAFLPSKYQRHLGSSSRVFLTYLFGEAATSAMFIGDKMLHYVYMCTCVYVYTCICDPPWLLGSSPNPTIPSKCGLWNGWVGVSFYWTDPFCVFF